MYSPCAQSTPTNVLEQPTLATRLERLFAEQPQAILGVLQYWVGDVECASQQTVTSS